MEKSGLNTSTISYVLSFAISSIFTSLLVIFKESNEGLKEWMANLTGHHWVTHGVFTILLFVFIGYILSKTNLPNKFSTKHLTNIIIWSSIIGAFLIIGFILLHIT
jgi:hypothetical protein